MKNWVHNFIYVFVLLVVIILTFSYFGKEIFLAPSVPAPSGPTITSLDPPMIVNDVDGIIQINGNGFNEGSTVTSNSGDVFSLRFINSNLIELDILAGFPVGNYELTVVNPDSSVSNPFTLTVNELFDYTLSLNPSVGNIVSASSFNAIVTISSLSSFMNPEPVTLTINSPVLEISSSGISCTPSPSCQILFTATAGSVVPQQRYPIDIIGTPSTSSSSPVTLTLTGISGQLLLCSNGVLDTNNGETDVDCGGPTCSACGEGKICSSNNDCFINPSCSVGLCYAPSGTQDLISVCAVESTDCDRVPDSVDACPGTPDGVVVDAVGCPILRCGDSVCNNGETCSTCNIDCGACTNVNICGDSVCDVSETCSTCPGDCGTCPENNPPGNGGGGGGGGGGSSRPVVKAQCADSKDNDNDGKVDLADAGCIDAKDNNESNIVAEINPIGGAGNTPETGNEQGSEERVSEPVKKDFEIGFVFWTVIILLGAGIIISIIKIVMVRRRDKLYEDLASGLPVNQSQSQTTNYNGSVGS